MLQFHETIVVSDLMTLNECVQFAGAAIVVVVRGGVRFEEVATEGTGGDMSVMYKGAVQICIRDRQRTHPSKWSGRGSEDGVGFALKAEGAVGTWVVAGKSKWMLHREGN
jgi:hypothetical protein